MLFAYVTGKEPQDYTIRAFAKGAGAAIIHTKDYLKTGMLPKTCSGIIFAGMLRGNMHIYNECLAKGINFYYLDHAYFSAGYGPRGWMRVTKNGFAQNNIVSADATRWNRHFQKPMRPYQFMNKNKILVLPPSDTVQKMFSVQDWRQKTVNWLRENTDKKIIVRDKSGPVLADNRTKLQGWQKFHHPQALDEMWDQLYCCVAYNSAAALDALMHGVPIITTKHGAAWPLSNRLDNINNLVKYDRQPLFTSLAWGQYNIDEMINGDAIRTINRFQQVIQ